MENDLKSILSFSLAIIAVTLSIVSWIITLIKERE